MPREQQAPVKKGKPVYLYGGTQKAQGVPTGATVTKGSAFSTYKPRAAQATCWEWLVLNAPNLIGQPVASVKAAAKAANHGHAISALLRHAARAGALTIKA